MLDGFEWALFWKVLSGLDHFPARAPPLARLASSVCHEEESLTTRVICAAGPSFVVHVTLSFSLSPSDSAAFCRLLHRHFSGVVSGLARSIDDISNSPIR